MTDILILALLALVAVGVVLQFLLFRRPASIDLTPFTNRLEALAHTQTRIEQALREELALARKEAAESARANRTEGASSLDTFGQRLSTLIDASEKRGEALRFAVEQRLDKLREENLGKLEEMRKIVDEKLQATLTQRLGESFKLVSERLEQVHKGLGEMQSLASGVGDLKRLMTNVKARGTWGEYQLGALLEQILAPEQFEANVATRPGSGERVEFAVRVPRPGDSERSLVYLPIDSKFPVEDYQRLLLAQDAADKDAVEGAARELEKSVRKMASDIATKYVCPPHTTDFGILFVPTEGLYAEVVRRTGLLEHCQRECRVCIAGPTTLAVILNSLQIVFRSIIIQQRSTEVWQVLGAVKTEFANFGTVFTKVRERLDQATREIDAIDVRRRVMDRKLKAVEMLGADAAKALLGDGSPLDGAA